MGCDELEPHVEAIADGTLELSPQHRAHLETCATCTARLEQARRIERMLSAREQPQPPASFTAAVMARLVQERWKVEQAVDIGFNLAIAAAVLIIIAGAAGTAWSLGLVTITIDGAALVRAAMSEVEGRMLNQVQSVLVAAVVLPMALGLWWWAEAATD